MTTRKPASYLLNRAYVGGVPFYVDERVIVPRSFIGELMRSEIFADAEGARLEPPHCRGPDEQLVGPRGGGDEPLCVRLGHPLGDDGDDAEGGLFEGLHRRLEGRAEGRITGCELGCALGCIDGRREGFFDGWELGCALG